MEHRPGAIASGAWLRQELRAEEAQKKIATVRVDATNDSEFQLVKSPSKGHEECLGGYCRNMQSPNTIRPLDGVERAYTLKINVVRMLPYKFCCQ